MQRHSKSNCSNRTIRSKYITKQRPRILDCIRLVSKIKTARKVYWALVAGNLAGAGMRLIVSYLMHPYRPRLSLAEKDVIWSFSRWHFLSRLGNYMSRRTDQFIIGGALGTQPMGQYFMAAEFSTMPTQAPMQDRAQTSNFMPASFRRLSAPMCRPATGPPPASAIALLVIFSPLISGENLWPRL